MSLKRLHLRRIFLVLAGLIGVYAVAGFFIAPGYLQGKLTDYLGSQSGMELAAERIRVNPFTFSMELTGSALADQSGEPVMEFERLFINFDVLALLWRTLVIRDLELEQPLVNLEYAGDGRTNLAPLFTRDTGGEEAADPGWVVLIENLLLTGGNLQWRDSTREPDLGISLREISLEAQNIGTGSGQTGQYTLTVDAVMGGALESGGNLELAPLTVNGSLELEDLELGNLSPWLTELATPLQTAGRLDLNGDYAYSGNGDGSTLQFADVEFNFTDLVLTAVETGRAGLAAAVLNFDALITTGATTETEFTLTEIDLRIDAAEFESSMSDTRLILLEQIRLKQGSLDTAERRIRIPDLSVAGGSAVLTRYETGFTDWSGMIGRLTADTAEDTTRPVNWAVSLERLTTEGLALTFSDMTLESEFAAELNAINLQVTGIDTAGGQPGEFTLAARVNETGSLESQGSVNAANGILQASLSLAGLDLRDFNPYMQTITTLNLQSGVLGADFEAGYQQQRIQLTGSIDGQDFSLAERASGNEVMALQALSAKGVVLDAMPLSMTIDTVSLTDPFTTIDIDPERHLNVSSWIKSTARDEAETGEDESETGESTVFVINRIEVNGGNVDFSDRSLSPDFSVTIDELAGGITGFSLDRQRTAALDLRGRINDYGSADITGRLRPFDPVRFSEIDMVIRNLDTSVLSPYSARFAGREIESGKLTLDLQYLVRESELQGNHDIALTDLVLGNRVESQDALDLPLDLAIALLKDSNNRIDINIPVSGDLSNPEFDIRSVVGKAVRKLLTGLVTAPFKLLGSLVGSENGELNRIPFAPGSAAITPPALETITDLSTALEKRPQLGLKAIGSYDPEVDREALARQQLRLHINLAAGLEAVNPDKPPPLAFTDPKIQDVLDEFALSRLGADKVTELTERYTGAGDSGATDPVLDREAYYEAVFTSLVEAEEIPRANLERVGRYRAQSIADQFSRLGIDRQRIVVADQVTTTDSSGRRVHIQLEVETAE